ncbi:g13335 [Coccomyxa viridis]|uniref:G13335 protein n=1 Tax=Coccomyxa viridis TaxID=1274662 RepID=A0ABP1GI06_9CHLO
MEFAERQVGMVPQYRSAIYTRDELETMQLLPKHTRVRVTGNQRTKTTQNGLEGVVKKSTGLGGWLCVLLSTGESINVQRNGVVVLEAPTGDEADFPDDDAGAQKHSVPLPRMRARRPIVSRASSPLPGVSKPFRRHQQYHSSSLARVNFNRLNAGALRRLGQFYNVPEVQCGSSLNELAYAVANAFTQESDLDERKVAMKLQKLWEVKRMQAELWQSDEGGSDH